MISYCVACFRANYSKILIAELERKTSCTYEILIWLNFEAPDLVEFVLERQLAGVPIRVVGMTPENIGMRAYRHLFAQARYDIIAQLDDDVLRISPEIAQGAHTLFQTFPNVKQLVADVWQDSWTNGSRYPMDKYSCINEQYGLYRGMIDGWFSMYHRSMLSLLLDMEYEERFYVGTTACFMLEERALLGLLCTKFKVLHLSGPYYAHYFDMLDFEIGKYARLGRQDLVASYQRARDSMPSKETLGLSLNTAFAAIDNFTPGI